MYGEKQLFNLAKLNLFLGIVSTFYELQFEFEEQSISFEIIPLISVLNL